MGCYSLDAQRRKKLQFILFFDYGAKDWKKTKPSQRPASQRPIKVHSYLQGGVGYRDIIIMYIS